MKRLIPYSFIIVLFLFSCKIFSQFDDAKEFVSCYFTINNSRVIELGGYDFTEVENISDIGLTEMFGLGQKMIAGEMDAIASVSISVTNKGKHTAAINGLYWQLFIKDEQYGNGEMLNHIEVLPGETVNFTVNTNFDISKLLKSEDLDGIFDLISDMENQEKLKRLDVKIKVKPLYKSGGTLKEYPSFITIKP